MTTAVRLYAHSGVVSVPVANQQLQTSDQGLIMLKQPYLGNETLSCDTVTVDTSDAAIAPANTVCALIEVQDSKKVHYELTPQNATLRTATTDSPTLVGNRTVQFGAGWRISVLEAA